MRSYRQTVASLAGRFAIITCALVACGIPVAAQTPSSTDVAPCSADAMQRSEGCILALAPGQTTNLPIAVSTGNVRAVTAEQVEGTVELRLPDAPTPDTASEPYTNHAGRHSRIRLLLTSGQQVIVGNSSKDKPAKVLLRVGSASPVDSNSTIEQAAEKAFAHAEVLRAGNSTDNHEILRAYDLAIANWRSLGNTQELARALTWKADFLITNEGSSVDAQPVIEQVSALLPKLDTAETAHYWLVMGFVSAVQGNYEAVRSSYGKALPLYTAMDDQALQAKILDNLARVEFMEGHADKAISDETQAANLASLAGDARRQAFVEEELGAIDSTLGDFEGSYQAYGDALAQLKRLPAEERMAGSIWVDLSDLYTTLGDLDRVKDALDQASAIWKRIDYPVGLVDTLNNYGDLYLLKNQMGAARASLQQGFDLAEKIGYERGSIATLGGLGDTYLYERDAEHAEDVLTRALGRAQKAKQVDFETVLDCQLGDAALLKHDFAGAQRFYEECRQKSVETKDSYNEIRAEAGLAHVAFKSDQLDEARSHCEHALAGIEGIRGHLRNQDLRTSFFASQHAYYDLDIQILTRLDRMHPNEGYAWQAFLIAERARARTLLDQVTTANTEMHTAASPALLAQYEDVQRRLRQMEASHPHTPQNTTATSAAIARLTFSEHQLHEEIRANSKQDVPESPHPLSLEALENALPTPAAALVEYWVGEETSYAWVITRRGIRSFRLPPEAQLERQCSAFRAAILAVAARDPGLTAEQRAALQPAQENRWRNLGSQLATTLFPSGMLSPSTTTVFIVGDGPVEAVAFAALPKISLLEPSNAPLRNITFLNEPSAFIFSVLETNLTHSRPMRLALFTLEQSRQTAEMTVAARNDRRDALASLPFTGNEAELIRAAIGPNSTRVFSGAALSKTSLQNLDWSQFSIGHFAMHAVLNERYAELSGLALDRGQIINSGNLLWYGDVRHLHAGLDLVVLSACDTALGEQVPGEGLRGLTQAFFAAGSQRVLGTLWEVDDQATSEWMGHFYRALKRTHSPAEALHEAQEKMAADPQWASPYYWAGFALAGDWRPLP
jgi:CHAT domain-containing protein